jgi:hypothetical protein
MLCSHQAANREAAERSPALVLLAPKRLAQEEEVGFDGSAVALNWADKERPQS